MTSLLMLLGTLLLLGLSIDVTLTLFSPFGHHGGPIHRRQNRFLWSVFRTLARCARDSMRPRILSLAGPVGVFSTVLLCSGWLIGGFALLYLPSLDTFRRLTATSAPHWLDALYYSGYVASTLGLGDVVPVSAPMRALTIVEAVAGFTLFAMSTTYLLTVTGEARLAVTLSMEIAAFRKVAADSTDGEHSAGGASDAGVSALAGRKAEAWSADLVRITDAHEQYPLLHYFRPVQEERSLVLQMGWIIAVLPGDGEPSPVFPDSARLLLAESVDGYLRGLNHGCVPASFAPVPADGASREELHGRLVRHLAYGPP